MAAMGFPLAFFDLDGTLLRGTSVSVVLARWLGRDGELDELERAYRAGRISNREIAETSAPWFRGTTIEQVAEVLAGSTWIDGIDETVDALRGAGTIPVLATVTWEFAARAVAERYGFAAFCGTRMGDDAGVLSGAVAEHFDAEHKAEFVRACCAEHQVDPRDAAAIGDSRSDLPMFGCVGFAVALNADAQARAAAGAHVDTDDLRDVVPLLSAPARR
jgi:phosphoserine phosphatase